MQTTRKNAKLTEIKYKWLRNCFLTLRGCCIQQLERQNSFQWCRKTFFKYYTLVLLTRSVSVILGAATTILHVLRPGLYSRQRLITELTLARKWVTLCLIISMWMIAYSLYLQPNEQSLLQLIVVEERKLLPDQICVQCQGGNWQPSQQKKEPSRILILTSSRLRERQSTVGHWNWHNWSTGFTVTKTPCLSTISSMFDLLGMIGPPCCQPKESCRRLGSWGFIGMKLQYCKKKCECFTDCVFCRRL